MSEKGARPSRRSPGAASKRPGQPPEPPGGGPAPKPRIRRIGLNYPPKVRREILQRLLSALDKQKRRRHT